MRQVRSSRFSRDEFVREAQASLARPEGPTPRTPHRFYAEQLWQKGAVIPMKGAGGGGVSAAGTAVVGRGVGARGQWREAARRWVAASADGYCVKTVGELGDCEAGHAGNFGLWLEHTYGRSNRSWENAARACLRSCALCARCNHVSISLRWKDCSWSHACDGLHRDVAGFRSAAAPRAAVE